MVSMVAIRPSGMLTPSLSSDRHAQFHGIQAVGAHVRHNLGFKGDGVGLQFGNAATMTSLSCSRFMMMFSLHVMLSLYQRLEICQVLEAAGQWFGAIGFILFELLVPSGISRVGSMIRQLIALTEPRAEECGQLCCAVRVSWWPR